jgi:hypothetical protein
MKAHFVAILLLTQAITAWAQTKITFNNDTRHLVYFSLSSAYLAPGDSALAGTLYSGASLGSGESLAVDLYMGTSSSSLNLAATTVFSSLGLSPWLWVTKEVVPAVPASTPYYFQVQVRDVLDNTAEDSMNAGHYFGYSTVFSGTPTITQYRLTDFWPAGTQDLSAFGSGYRGAIELKVVPEPATLSLAVFALLVARAKSTFTIVGG